MVQIHSPDRTKPKNQQLTCIPREREPFLRPMSGQNPDSRRGPLLLTTSR